MVMLPRNMGETYEHSKGVPVLEIGEIWIEMYEVLALLNND
jgi:hypothetical protein